MRFEQDDYIMRQIEMITVIVSRLTDGVKGEAASSQEESPAYGALMGMLDEGRINEAENLLFEQLESHSIRNLKLSLDFYSKLNGYDDKRLEKAGFSREEIKSGLDDVMKAFGIQNL